ncbi:MAG: S41 family peptidase [Firmicutes bacterium]|nr:S41 family peptidase [Bacillota bacterium]
MVRIRKSVLALIIVLALAVGGAAGGFAGMRARNYIETENGIVVSREEFDDYQYLVDTYGKADFIRDYILENYYTDVDEAELDEGLYYGLFAGLGDVYSGYFTAEDYDYMMSSLTGTYSGVGITMEPTEIGYVQITALTEGAPAQRAGLKTGDIIYAVDDVTYNASTMDICAASIRGDIGTTVKITVLRDGESIDYTVRREEIHSVTVSSKMLEDGIGYIRLSSFDETSAQEFSKALESIEKQGAHSFVFDLRGNPGGLVDVCVEIADMLMDKGTVVYIEDRAGNREYESTESGRTKMNYVVLVDGGSASSSEILSAGIQDNGEGKIVGTVTFGKGIIQVMDRFSDGSGVKITRYQYFSPNGRAIHGNGITPDYIVELTEDCFDEEGNLIRDPQLDKALELLR